MAEPALAGEAGDRYPQLLRTPRRRWWRPLLGLLMAGAALLVGGVGVFTAAYVLAAVTGQSDAFSTDELGTDSVLELLTLNLSLAVLVPAAALSVVLAHRERAGWLASVTGRLRVGLLLRLLGLAVVLVLAYFSASFLLPDTDDMPEAVTPSAGTFLGLLAVILLTTPLQAAAEEVGFRGYLSQAVASYAARPMVGTVVAGAVSALLFALAHGVQDAWLFGDRLAFGIAASWLAWRTGGLEAPIALHVANNLVSLVYSAATGTLEASLTASELDWRYAVLDVTMIATFAAVTARLCRRWRVETHRDVGFVAAVPRTDVSAPTLAGHEPVGYPGPRSSTPPPAGRENPWGMG